MRRVKQDKMARSIERDYAELIERCEQQNLLLLQYCQSESGLAKIIEQLMEKGACRLIDPSKYFGALIGDDNTVRSLRRRSGLISLNCVVQGKSQSTRCHERN